MMITSFDLRLSWNEERRKVMFQTLDDYTFFTEGKFIIIPKGYETDFATVPRLLWSLLPPLGKHNPAALVHDWLYDNREGTRSQADKIFLKLMLEYDVHPLAAYAMYYGVRIGGRKWWHRTE